METTEPTTAEVELRRRTGISVYVEGHGDLYPIRGDDGSRMWAVRPEPDAVALDVVFDGDHADLVPGLLLLVSPSPDVAKGEPDATRARLAVKLADWFMAASDWDNSDGEFTPKGVALLAAYRAYVTAGRTAEGKEGGHA